MSPHQPLKGRGVPTNPPNRFEQISYEPDPDLFDEADSLPSPRTTLLRDPSRTILSRNDSPDIGFTFSVNPYRGCEHGCVYCLSGDTLIFMADGSMRVLEELKIGDEIYGTERRGWYRRYIKTRVLSHWKARKPAFKVTLADGTSLITSGDHRFLAERGWKYVSGSGAGRERRPHLTVGNKLMGFGAAFAVPPFATADYQIGYLCGVIRGDGHILQAVDSSILRKRSIENQAVKSRANLRVLSVEQLGVELPMYDIMTGTGDFIANGVVSHNCYARPTHEWLGFSAGLDFETRIVVKEQAPQLLQAALASPGWRPQIVALSGVTDPYQPIERRLQLTRGCLEVLVDFRNPVAIVTKNALITRDCDLLAQLARDQAAAVIVSITTLDAELARRLEPRASSPAKRLEAIRTLAQAGIPVGVNVAPIIPGLTDTEAPAIVIAAARAGASFAGHTMVRLPYGVADLFVQWLETHYPERKDKVLNKIRSMRRGKLNDARWCHRMRGEGLLAETIHAIFTLACRKAGLDQRGPALSTAAFRRPGTAIQLRLFSPKEDI